MTLCVKNRGPARNLIPQQTGCDRRLSRCLALSPFPVLVSFRDQKVRELPRIGCVELGLVVAAEEIGVVLQRGPVGGYGDELAQVGLADLQHLLVRQVVGHAHPRRGFSSIHKQAATTEIATCIVVAF